MTSSAGAPPAPLFAHCQSGPSEAEEVKFKTGPALLKVWNLWCSGMGTDFLKTNVFALWMCCETLRGHSQQKKPQSDWVPRAPLEAQKIPKGNQHIILLRACCTFLLMPAARFSARGGLRRSTEAARALTKTNSGHHIGLRS